MPWTRLNSSCSRRGGPGVLAGYHMSQKPCDRSLALPKMSHRKVMTVCRGMNVIYGGNQTQHQHATAAAPQTQTFKPDRIFRFKRPAKVNDIRIIQNGIAWSSRCS